MNHAIFPAIKAATRLVAIGATKKAAITLAGVVTVAIAV
jgi:hypothetical protein